MAPSRRQSNGRSPLVNQQRQITSFFTKPDASPSPSPSPSPSLLKPKTPNSNPNPNPIPDPPCRNPSPSPATPSPVQSKPKKPLLVIGKTPSPPKPAVAAQSYGDEVVGKRVRVYWPLDKRWYDGCVGSYDKELGQHLIEYDDGEEESLDLGKEKIEWVVGESVGSRFKRLRRGLSASRKVVIEDNEEMENVDEEVENKSDGDDSSDEDWGKNAEKEVIMSDEDVDVELEDDRVDEEELLEEEDEDEEIPKGKTVGKTESRKRKANGGEKSGGGKKSRINTDLSMNGFKASVVEPVKKKDEGEFMNVVTRVFYALLVWTSSIFHFILLS